MRQDGDFSTAVAATMQRTRQLTKIVKCHFPLTKLGIRQFSWFFRPFYSPRAEQTT
jgi:hypothetical protein